MIPMTSAINEIYQNISYKIINFMALDTRFRWKSSHPPGTRLVDDALRKTACAGWRKTVVVQYDGPWFI